MRLPITLAALALLFNAPVGAQITVDPMGPATFCGSPTVNVPFTAPGTYNVGNMFVAELSDATGSFAAPSVIGSLPATTSGSISCTFPAGMGGGFAMRITASDPPEMGTAYPLSIFTVVPPNAGSNGVITVCSNSAPVSLFSALGGIPDAGGAWTNPAGNPAPLSFIPGTSIPGCYTYTVFASLPCANETSTVCVSVNQAPDAGINGSVTICSSDAPFSLLASLGGSPQAGGTWSYSGGPYSGVYNPAVDLPGCYVYTVPGTPPCVNASATVCVTVVAAPNAGIDGMITMCSAGPEVDLFALLGGSAQPGGTWNAPLDATGGFYDPATMSPGIYSYTVDLGSCGTDDALINVIEWALPMLERMDLSQSARMARRSCSSINWAERRNPVDLGMDHLLHPAASTRRAPCPKATTRIR
ncbi:MAG: hypothetical protein IPL52_17060 [Flavobacteriales bacterium]|nr:hypothetical protein [Flavobacteriales bacterium]